jgi:hypothetical protein
MKTEIVVAVISAVVALGTAMVTGWNSMAIEKLKTAAQREKEVSGLREPMARAAYDLQSRLFNILRQGVIGAYLVNGNDREKSYFINNTAFLIGQYLCWTELIRREIQFIDLGSDQKTSELIKLQDKLYSIWNSDKQSKTFRLFAGEQRAIGEALVKTGGKGPECIGYGEFLTTFTQGKNALIDDLRIDVSSLAQNLDQTKERLLKLQHALVDLLDFLDPRNVRFEQSRRTKA